MRVDETADSGSSGGLLPRMEAGGARKAPAVEARRDKRRDRIMAQ
jgi:hypothetical protein